MYGFRCEHCDTGRVRREIRPREFIPVTRTDHVALEQVPLGVCDRCNALYYPAAVLRQAESLWEKKPRSRKVTVPVARYVPVP